MTLADKLRAITQSSSKTDSDRMDKFAHKWYNVIYDKCDKAAHKGLSRCIVYITYRFWEMELSPEELAVVIKKILNHLDSEGVIATEKTISGLDNKIFCFEVSW